MSARPPRDRRFLSYVVVLLLLATFAWSLFRAWTIVQDHRRHDAAPAASAPA